MGLCMFFLFFVLGAAPASACATARTAAFARRAFLRAEPDGQDCEGENHRQDYGRCDVHLRAGLMTAQRQNTSTITATTAQKPKPPPAKKTPSW